MICIYNEPYNSTMTLFKVLIVKIYFLEILYVHDTSFDKVDGEL